MKKIIDKIKIPFIIFITAFIVRLFYIKITGINDFLDPDSVQYLSYANNLLAGNGYADGKWQAFRPPGYPFFVALIYFLFGKSVITLKIIQALISSFIPVLVYFIGQKIMDKKYSLLSAFYACFYLGLYQEPAHLLSEAVFTPLFVLSILFLLKINENNIFSFLSGITLGLTTFSRPVGLLILPVSILWLLLKFKKKEFIKISLLLILGFITILLPWWIRNYKIFHTFVPVCLETGFVMRHAHSSEEQLKYLNEFDNLPELERDRKNFQMGINYFKSMSLIHIMKRWFKNLLMFFYPFLPEYDITYMLILPLWFYGIYIVIKNKSIGSYLLFSMLIYIPIAIFFFPTVRYRHSVGAFFILISFFGLKSINSLNNKKIYYSILVWIFLNTIILSFSSKLRLLIKGILL